MWRDGHSPYLPVPLRTWNLRSALEHDTFIRFARPPALRQRKITVLQRHMARQFHHLKNLSPSSHKPQHPLLLHQSGASTGIRHLAESNRETWGAYLDRKKGAATSPSINSVLYVRARINHYSHQFPIRLITLCLLKQKGRRDYLQWNLRKGSSEMLLGEPVGQ